MTIGRYFPQKELYDLCKLHAIQIVAHCPLGGSLAPAVAGRKGRGPLEDPAVRTFLTSHATKLNREILMLKCQILRIAETNFKTPAQVILAWTLGRGVCVVPKSNRNARIAENFDCTFPLTEAENEEIANVMGNDGEYSVRNLDSQGHIGFDVYDEKVDQPMY